MTPWQISILCWYDEHRRELPWRGISDPYRIWVSEIILQQTRVQQGRAYYERFVKAFPTVLHLAEATEDEVLRLWQGLGYYSRARNMHAAARQIVELGQFPDTYEGIRSLKGVGDYTAAAIGSFAFGLPCAVVDGNVYRVLSRHFADETPIDTTQGRKHFSELATALLPSNRSADYNQALMDFGAMQCVPKNPDCARCPLAGSCASAAQGMVDAYPVKSHRTKVSERHFAYVVVMAQEGVWLHRREGGDIWQGLYEFPLLEFSHEPNLSEVANHPWVKAHVPQGAAFRQVASRLKHVLTHRCLWAEAYVVRLEHADATVPPGMIWVPLQELEHYALPKLVTLVAQKAELIP